MRASCLSVALSLTLPSLSLAATTQVNSAWTNAFGAGIVGGISDAFGNPLSLGDPNLGSDGAVFQIGVFMTPSVAQDPTTYSPEDWASFRPLTGLGSENPSINTTIGDVAPAPTAANEMFGIGLGAPPGLYSIGVVFDDGVHGGLPAAPRRIGIRFFDSVGSADGQFNTVTSIDSGWEWVMPADPAPSPASASLDAIVDASSGAPFNPAIPLVWQDGGNPFRTTIPEPSVSILSLLGLACLLRRRR